MAGMILPVQVAINALLRNHVGQAMQATFVSFAIGTFAALGVCVFYRHPLPTMSSLSNTSWWMWTGGIFGVFYVWATIFTAPKIGTSLAFSLIITGQMLAAILLDHFGAFGLEKMPISLTRIIGAILIVSGVILVASTKR